MTACFRVLLFVPDPFNGMSWPLGAVVDTQDGLEVARSGRLPDAAALGSQRTALLARRMHRRLNEFCSFDAVPISFGPYAVLGEKRTLPEGVENPVQWIEEHVLPRATAKRRASRTGTVAARVEDSRITIDNKVANRGPSTGEHVIVFSRRQNLVAIRPMSKFGKMRGVPV